MGTTERRLRERARKEADIIGAAMELFLAKGYNDTTVDDIANRLELSKGAIYLHFQSKEEIYFAVALQGLKILSDRFKEAASGPGTGMEKLERMGKAYVEFWSAHPDYRRLLQDPVARGAPSPSGQYAKRFAEVGRETNALMVRTAQEGLEDGSMASDAAPEEIAFIVSSSLDGVLSRLEHHVSLKDGNGMDREKLLGRTFEMFIKALAGRPTEGNDATAKLSTGGKGRKKG